MHCQPSTVVFRIYHFTVSIDLIPDRFLCAATDLIHCH